MALLIADENGLVNYYDRCKAQAAIISEQKRHLVICSKFTAPKFSMAKQRQPTSCPARDSRHSAVDPRPKDFSAGVQLSATFLASIGASLEVNQF